MVLYSAAGAHASSGDDDHGTLDVVDGLGLINRLDQLQVGEIKRRSVQTDEIGRLFVE